MKLSDVYQKLKGKEVSCKQCDFRYLGDYEPKQLFLHHTDSWFNCTGCGSEVYITKEEKHMSRDEQSTYYDEGGIEVFDIIKAKLTKEQLKGFYLGNAIKYSTRMNWKTPDEPIRDAQKAANYSQWLKELLEEEG